MSLLLLSPCVYPDASWAALTVESAQRQGLVISLFGVGERYIPHGADAQLVKLEREMSKGKAADHVMVTDCRDVLFFANTNEIMEKFEAFHSPLVMAADCECWPIEDDLLEKFGIPGYYRYLNAGQYIGEWNYVLTSIRHLLDNYRGKGGADNSQGWWMRALMNGELDFSLDRNCRLFNPMSGQGKDHIRVEGKRVRNTYTGSLPASLHFNGYQGKEPHREMWERLRG